MYSIFSIFHLSVKSPRCKSQLGKYALARENSGRSWCFQSVPNLYGALCSNFSLSEKISQLNANLRMVGSDVLEFKYLTITTTVPLLRLEKAPR